MIKLPILFVVLFASNVIIHQAVFAQTKPISLHPQNNHYFIYHSKPTVLITSGEHYGAVLNLDFDYVPYLDELKSRGLNLTRTFTGEYVEPQGAFNITHNSLAPLSGRFICPWERSDQPGYSNGGNKFDLTHWDQAYFNRLKDFVSSARARNVIVELSLFCPFYEEVQWNVSPLNAANNINGFGPVGRTDVYTMDKSGGLLKIQEAMVRKIVNELKEFDNVIYEICNEPYFGGVTIEWQHHIATIINEMEKPFSYRHLISQNIANGSAKIESPDSSVSVFNFHYASPPDVVSLNYHLNKVIGDNETGFRGTTDSTYRKEGWQFILAGGALYNNLDYSFTAEHENGTFQYPSTQPGGGTLALRKQLGILKDFIFGFDFIRMKPDSTIITGGLPANVIAYALAEPGKQYAIYLFGGTHVNLEISIPAGRYKVEWINTLTGKIAKRQLLDHSGKKVMLISPEYTEDIAVRIKRNG